MRQYDANYNLTIDGNPFAKITLPDNKASVQEQENPIEDDKTTFNISDEAYDNLQTDGKALYIKSFLSQQKDFLSNVKNPMAVIAGIIGVWSNESALKRTASNKMELKKWKGEDNYKAGRGIAQWSLGRNKTYAKWSGGKYANEDTIDNQLKFALLEATDRPALMEALANAETPEQAADAWRRGFENGSRNALASSKHMDSYEKVGSPGASAIYKKDTKKANYYYDLFTGNGLMKRVGGKLEKIKKLNDGNIWR